MAIAGCGTTAGVRAGRTTPAPPPASAGPAPQSFAIPQVGRVGFRCGSAATTIQPFYDGHGTTSEDVVTIQAGPLIERNYTTRVVGHAHGRPLIEIHSSTPTYLALPYGDYGTVVFTIEQGTEARIIHARAVVEFRLGASGRLRWCYARRWAVVETVS